MPVSGTLIKVVFGGRLFTDEWATSLHFLSATGAPVPQASGAVGSLLLWFQGTGAGINKGALLDYVKVNAINPVTGLYADPNNTNESAFTPAGVPPFSQANVAQLALAVTLLTDFQRGRGHRGRVYPPTRHAGVQPDGRLLVSEAVAVNNAFATLLNDLTTAFINYVPVIYSKLGQTATPIKRTTVGRVVDTQRRRRSSLEESYVDPIALGQA